MCCFKFFRLDSFQITNIYIKKLNILEIHYAENGLFKIKIQSVFFSGACTKSKSENYFLQVTFM